MNQLYELSRQFPDEWIKPAPKGKFGNYIPHSVITQRLLEVCGPFNCCLLYTSDAADE
mgnify:CR=1 FL=1